MKIQCIMAHDRFRSLTFWATISCSVVGCGVGINVSSGVSALELVDDETLLLGMASGQLLRIQNVAGAWHAARIASFNEGLKKRFARELAYSAQSDQTWARLGASSSWLDTFSTVRVVVSCDGSDLFRTVDIGGEEPGLVGLFRGEADSIGMFFGNGRVLRATADNLCPPLIEEIRAPVSGEALLAAVDCGESWAVVTRSAAAFRNDRIAIYRQGDCDSSAVAEVGEALPDILACQLSGGFWVMTSADDRYAIKTVSKNGEVNEVAVVDDILPLCAVETPDGFVIGGTSSDSRAIFRLVELSGEVRDFGEIPGTGVSQLRVSPQSVLWAGASGLHRRNQSSGGWNQIWP